MPNAPLNGGFMQKNRGLQTILANNREGVTYNSQVRSMAQAARLSLRMQKELKLLLSDPPPGASFPFLSAATDAALSSPSPSSSSSSLTAIDAEIEGPEGTVYAGGIFKIRIQIPERYPFQPPTVTFATPIYHPNIDNGGRICLDILNLRPKGAWQPSLNVSTVITSIGLLLSEPNPDDGLMCEASREFKYNRQAFDLKARTMTEKYANSSSGMASSTQGTQQTVEHRLTGDIEVGHEIKTEDSSCIINSSKPPGMSKKLSLDLSASNCEKNSNGKTKQVTDSTNEAHSVGVSNFRKKQKLSLNSLSQPKQSECDNQNSLVDQQVPSNSTPTMIQAVNGSKLQSSQVSNYNQQEPEINTASQGNVSSTYENCRRYTGSKRLSLGFSVMSRILEKCENENPIPVGKLTSERLEKSKEKLSSNSVKPGFAKQGGAEELQDCERDNCKGFFKPQDLSLSEPKSCSMAQQRDCFGHSSIEHRDAAQNKQQPDPSFTVIVLDSDESDQEEKSRCRRPKLSLLSKRPTLGNAKEHKALVRPTSETSP